jgi:hypothetical protein
MIAYGCEKDDDDSDTPVPQTNAPSQKMPEPKPIEPHYCFPTNYSVPQPSIDRSNRVSTTTLTIGTPDGPFYRMTVTTVANDSAAYSDGTTITSEGTIITETTVSEGATNATQSINQEVSIVLFDNTQIASTLVTHSTNGIQDQNQHNAFLECNDGKVTAITEEQFDSFRTQLGIR